MNGELFGYMFVTLIGMCGFLLVLVLLGKREIKIKFQKKLGMLKGKVVANEIRKDGKLYTNIAKINSSEITIGDRTYDYDINDTVVNTNDMREAWFSEITGKQLKPYGTKEGEEVTTSPQERSKMIMFATAMAMMPKPSPFNLKNLPIMFILIAIIVIVAMVTGVVKI